MKLGPVFYTQQIGLYYNLAQVQPWPGPSFLLLLLHFSLFVSLLSLIVPGSGNRTGDKVSNSLSLSLHRSIYLHVCMYTLVCLDIVLMYVLVPVFPTHSQFWLFLVVFTCLGFGYCLIRVDRHIYMCVFFVCPQV